MSRSGPALSQTSMPDLPPSNVAERCPSCGNGDPGYYACHDCGAEIPPPPIVWSQTASIIPSQLERIRIAIGPPRPTRSPFPPSSGRSPLSQVRKIWYKRPLYVIPAVLLSILLASASVVAYLTMTTINQIQSVSTPPPEISSASLGGSQDVVIDTDAAQQAVREQRDHEVNFSTTTSQSPAATEVPRTGDSVHLVPKPPLEANANGINILIMGVDARNSGTIDVGVRPDALGVVNLNQETGSCRLLAVPRDSRVNLPGYGHSKVNHALAIGGIPYEMLVVEKYLDIEIDHYALVDFSGLIQVVDTIGGVTVDNPEAFSFFGATTFPAGEIHLNGEDALSYARYRGGVGGDFSRISRQQQVIRGLIDQSYDLNLVRLVPGMFSLLSDHFRTDLSAGELILLADTYRTTCTSTTMAVRTIVGDILTSYDDLTQENLSFVISDPATVQDEVEWLLGD